MDTCFRYCRIWGNLMSSRAHEQYPLETVCSECIESDNRASGDHQRILSIHEIDRDPLASCYFCELMREDLDE